MKKNYMIPQMECHHYQVEGMIAASITKIGGDADLTLGGDDETGLDANVKGNPFGESIFD